MINALPFFAVLGLLVLAVVCFIHTKKLFRFLERSHPVVWVKLGRPRSLFGSSIRNNLVFLAFITRTARDNTANPALRSAACRWGAWMLAYVIYFFAILFLFVLIVHRGHKGSV
jgi:hypothetical protein